jgi:hypothetical protein
MPNEIHATKTCPTIPPPPPNPPAREGGGGTAGAGAGMRRKSEEKGEGEKKEKGLWTTTDSLIDAADGHDRNLPEIRIP